MTPLEQGCSPLKRALPCSASWMIAGILPLLLLGLSFIRIIGDAGSAALGGAVLTSVLTEPLWGTRLGTNLLWHGLALVLIHLGIGALCLLLASMARYAWPQNQNSHAHWTLCWLCVICLWILIANAALFPASSLGAPYADLVTASTLGMSLFAAVSIAIATAAALTTFTALWRIPRQQLRRWPTALSVLAVAGGTLAVAVDAPASRTSPPPAQPNVILIGLDSLRADALGTGVTPALDRFMSHATRFTDATTPLARTFPAWVSLISGKHPHTTGATINLLPRDLINTGDTLPTLLNRQGFETLYAIDEVRFSNLDTSYGFNAMATPHIGATDFVLGFFADTPLSNLLVNTAVGRWLFPYTHGNRAAATTYDPDVFLKQIERALPDRAPLLLATHFTLAHWPYAWAGSRFDMPSANGDEDDKSSLVKAYDHAAQRVDLQFDQLMELLERRGALQNAIVIVFSDHGESLGESVDHNDDDAGKYYGHGTSVLARDQYHVVLGFRAYGNQLLGEQQTGRDIAAPVSLEDITPTLLALLNIDTREAFDGQSLLPLIRQDTFIPEQLEHRIRFTETEFNPPGIAPGTLMSASALANAAKYYQVDPHTDRITINRHHIRRIQEQRQFAAFSDGLLLAAMPDTSGIGHNTVLALENGEARTVDAAMLDTHPDLKTLWTALQGRFPHLAAAPHPAPPR